MSAKKKAGTWARAPARVSADQFPPGAKAFGALLALAHANADGRAPSAEAVKIIADFFTQWLEQDGHQTFDQVLGFAGERGRAPYLERLRRTQRDLFLAHLVCVLYAGGIRPDTAAEIVSVAVNRSSDVLFRKQLRQVGAVPPSAQRARSGAVIEHLPAKSIKKAFEGLGGEGWARLAGYCGEDCDERRKLPLLDLNDNETRNFLTWIGISRDFPFRTLAEIRAIVPLKELPADVADELRAK